MKSFKYLLTGSLINLLMLINVCFSQNISNENLLQKDDSARKLISSDIYKAYDLAFANYEALISNDYDQKSRARVLFTLSMVYNAVTDYPMAIKLGLEAINIYKKLKLYDELVTAYSSLGGIYYNTFDYDRTILFTEKAIQIAEKNSIIHQLPLLYNNLSGAYLQKGMKKEALKSALKSKKFTINNAPLVKSSIYGTLSEIYYELGDYQNSQIYIDSAFNAFEDNQIKNRLLLVGHLFQKATINFKLQDTITALNAALKAYQLSDSAGFIIFEKESSKLLSIIYSSLNNTDSSQYYSVNYDLLNKEIWNQNKERQMNKMVIKVREQELEENVNEANRQRLITLGIFVFVIILGILSILLMIINSKKQRLLKKVKAQKDEIEEKNHELEAYHIVKDKIFSTVIHDFKTPLNSLETILGLLEKQKLNMEDLSSLSRKLKVNVLGSKQSINNLILWAKNQMAGVEPSYELVEINQLVEKIRQYHELSLLEKKINLIIEDLPNSYFYTDPEILFITLNNILSNAIKFSKSEQSIRLNIKIINRVLTISIEDTGTGIKHEDIEEVFSVKRITKKGSGIGLAVTKELLSKLKGTIAVTSQVNIGTTFTIQIPSSDSQTSPLL